MALTCKSGIEFQIARLRYALCHIFDRFLRLQRQHFEQRKANRLESLRRVLARFSLSSGSFLDIFAILHPRFIAVMR